MKKILLVSIFVATGLVACNGNGGSSSSNTTPTVSATQFSGNLPTDAAISSNMNPIFYKYNDKFGESYTMYFPNPNGSYVTGPGPLLETSVGIGGYVTADRNIVLMSASGREYLRDPVTNTFTKFDFSNYRYFLTAQTSQPFTVYEDANGTVNLATGTYLLSGGVVTATAVTPAHAITVNYSNCNSTALAVTAINTVEVTPGIRYLGVGTSSGDICFIGITGPAKDTVINATSSQNVYQSGSPVMSIVTSATHRGNFVYWYNQNDQLWRAVYDLDGNLNSFDQINGSTYGNVPSNINTIYADTSGDIFAGTTTGQVYVLTPNSKTWASVQLKDKNGTIDRAIVQAISTGINGGIFATTLDGKVYTISIN